MLGVAIVPTLVVGVEVESGGSDGPRGWRGMSWSSVVALWYPRRDGRGYVKLGASRTAGVVAGPPDARGGYRHSSGHGWTAGVGYDARLSRHFSLTPYATWAVAANADLPHPVNTTAARYGGQVLLAGVALTVR